VIGVLVRARESLDFGTGDRHTAKSRQFITLTFATAGRDVPNLSRN
jgi:hypothetical protein